MTDTRNPSTLERVLTALAEIGPATAAHIGQSIGIAYPTTTPKLRELESTGHAERIRTEQRTTLWQLTETGKAAAASVAAGSASMQASSAASANDDDRTEGESQQPANRRPEAKPEPDTEAPAEGQPPTDQQTGDSTAETGQASPTPAEAAGPVWTAEHAPQAEFDPKPTPELAPISHPKASNSGTTQDQPSGDPRADDRVGELETDSTAVAEHQTPPLAEEPGTSTQEGDGRRKPAQPRRRKGELRDEVLALLRRNPGTAYKVAEICKLLNQTHDGAHVNKASAGAVTNALFKLAIAGTVKQIDTKVATYQAE
ncbi:hypothetical protein GCM10027290_30060 [Micromonospora sonneratiae]|uniref:MarR family transcriptional regulator n=1 Tax=Micromonospora sonneratiae TaxID=1184706 RepID=A0ABW3YFM9_9ACTN